MAARRRTEAQWEALSEAQRRRYLSSGRTGKLNGKKGLTEAQVKRYYLSGKSLKSARGKGPAKVVTKAPPKSAVRAAERGQATDKDRKALRSWRESSAYPSWLSKDRSVLGDDIAAILAQIVNPETGLPVPPERWESLSFVVNPDGTVTMKVQRKGGNQYGRPKIIEVTFPDAQRAREALSYISRQQGQERFKGIRVEPPTDSPGPKRKRA